MPSGISFHSSGIHPSSFHLAEAHPVEGSHPSGSKPAGNDIEKPGSPAVASGHDPFPSSSTGLPSGSRPKKSVLRDIKLQDDPNHYVIKNPDKNGGYELFMRDEATDAPIDTGQKVRSDGQGGLEKVSNPDASKPASSPILPPAAKIDPKQLGPLKPDGMYPGKDGNKYALSIEGHHPMSYDKQLQAWMAVDPGRPHDFTRSVPVKLDGKGGAEPLPRARLKGGLDPIDRKKTKDLRIATARERVVQAEARAEGARVAWQNAAQHYNEALAHSADVNRDLQRTSSQLRELNRQHQRLNQSRNREKDPVRLGDINRQLAAIDEQIFTATSAYNGAYQASVTADRNLSAATAQSLQATEAYQGAEQDRLAAQDRFNHVLRE
jgi:hypothetical protein